VGLKHEDESREAVLKLFAAGMSQDEIAKALRIAQSTVSRWITDVDAEKARRLASLSALQLMLSDISDHSDIQADEASEAYDAVMADWGAPTGPEHDSHGHGKGPGAWKCLSS
jgi:transcriptional regulator with XRE-family HTH domain